MTPTQINAAFPNSGTATPADLRQALIDASGSATVIQDLHAAASAAAARTVLGATATGSALFTAADQAAARAAIGAATTTANANVRTGSHSLAASGVPGHEIFSISTAATLTLPLTSACPVGSWLVVVNFRTSTAPLTISRAGSDTIDSLTSVTIYPGETVMLSVSTGIWRQFNEPTGWRRIQAVTVSGAPATIDLPLPAEFAAFRIEALLWPSVAAIIQARFSTDGGSTYLAGAADYRLNVISNSGGTASAAAIDVNAMRFSVGVQVATVADALASTATVFPGGGGVSPRLSNVAAGFESGGGANQQAGVVQNVARVTTTRATHLRLLTSTGTFANGGVIRVFGLA